MLRALKSGARRLAREEDGFTLVELLVASVLGLIVVGAAVMMFTAGIKSEPRAASRSAQIQQARTTMERVTRELRQGSSVPTATTSQLSILTWVKSATCGGASSTTAIQCQVTYTCTGACMRTERNPDGTGSGPAEQVVSGLSGSPVFSYTPSAAEPAHVGVTLQFPAGGGEDAISLQDGVTLRNAASGS